MCVPTNNLNDKAASPVYALWLGTLVSQQADAHTLAKIHVSQLEQLRQESGCALGSSACEFAERALLNDANLVLGSLAEKGKGCIDHIVNSGVLDQPFDETVHSNNALKMNSITQ